jgi:alkanesulfonate monooxygenase SsuD/methylene tetrahydromethanopterin reductase-like flavin-dependent oxidoreductase (luciferase family)
VDEQQPGADEPFDDDVYVRAWWQRSEYLHGEHRDDSAAYALDWAEAGVRNQVRHGDPVSVVSLLYRLLDAPDAVPSIVAYGPLPELLEDRGPEVEQDVARLCATEPPGGRPSPRWS